MEGMESYDSSQIQIIEVLKASKKVRGMYIGSTDQLSLHHLVYEVLENSVDEANAGHATPMLRGIPFYRHQWIDASLSFSKMLLNASLCNRD